MKPAHSIPTGLLAIRDLIDRHPESGEEILAYEIRRRERERLLFQGGKKLLQFHVWIALKTILVAGATVFLFAWSLGAFAQFAQWFKQVQNAAITIPIPLAKDVRFDIGKYAPTSSVLEYAAHFPMWDLRDAGLIALAAMALVLAEKLGVSYLTWRHVRELQGAAKELEEEIAVLKEWKK